MSLLVVSGSEITSVGSAGNVHGPWGNDVTEVSIDIALPTTTAFCEVSWRQWAVDSRDGETDRVLIDGEEVCSSYSRPFPPPALSPLFSLCLLSLRRPGAAHRLLNHCPQPAVRCRAPSMTNVHDHCP